MSTRLTARLGATALAFAFAASPAFAQTSPMTPPANSTGTNMNGTNPNGMNATEMNSPSGTSTEPMSTTHSTMRHHGMHHARARHTGEGKLMPTKAGDEAIERLNAQSLAAAQSGQTFTPSGTPSSPAATAQPRGGMHNHMNMHDNTSTPDKM